MASMPPSTTAASRLQPVCDEMDCAAVTVSIETRFNLPSRCSTTTRIVSAMNSFGKRGAALRAGSGHEGDRKDHGERKLNHRDLCFCLRDLVVRFCSSARLCGVISLVKPVLSTTLLNVFLDRPGQRSC